MIVKNIFSCLSKKIRLKEFVDLMGIFVTSIRLMNIHQQPNLTIKWVAALHENKIIYLMNKKRRSYIGGWLPQGFNKELFS